MTLYSRRGGSSLFCINDIIGTMDLFQHKSIDNASEFVKTLAQFRETLLANLIALAEIPAPTGNTKTRAQAIASRISEYNMLDVSIDKVGNVIAKMNSPKMNAQNTIALLAHMDTFHHSTYDHTVHVSTDSITGVGLADNSLGTAVLVTLPYIMQTMNYAFDSDIILCFVADSLGAGDLLGTRFFLDNTIQSIDYGVCVEGYPLGRTSYASIGVLRAEIHHRTTEEFDWTRFGTSNAIVNINHIINRILEIPLPNRPRTSIIFNKIRSGTSFNITPTESVLLFEVRSHSNEIVTEIQQQIQGIISETASEFGAEVTLKEVARRSIGGLSYSHPLVRKHSEILNFLSIGERITPSFSDISAFIDRGIPALVLGITQCERYNQSDELMYIMPCFTGIAQLLLLISALDSGEVI